LAALLLFWGAAEWLMRSDWFEQRLMTEVRARIEQALGGVVEIGAVSFDRSTFAVTIHDLTARADPSMEPFLRLPVMRVGLRIDSFWRAQASLETIVAEGPEIRIESGPDGITNLPEGSGGKADPFALGVGLADVRDAVLVWNDEPRRLSALVEDLDLLARPEADSGCVAVRLTAASSSARLDAKELTVASAKADARVCADRVEIAVAEFGINGAEAKIAGEVRNLDDPEAALQVSASGPLAALAAFLPEGVSPQGSFTYDGDVEWRPMQGSAAYQGDLTASGVRLSRFEKDAPAGSLAARLAGDQDRLRLDGIDAEAFGGRFRGKAEISEPFGAPRVALEGDVEGFRLRPLLESIAGQGGPDLRRAPWTASVRAHVKAATEAAGALTAELDIELEGVGERPLSGEIHGRYLAASSRIEVDTLALDTGGATLHADGAWAGTRADLRLRWDGDNERDLQEALGLLGVDLAGLPVELLGETHLAGTLEGRIAPQDQRDFVFDGRLNTGAIRLLNYEWTSLETELVLRQDLLRIGNARLRDGQGTAELTIEAELEPGVPLARKPLLGWVRARNLPAEKALAAGRLPALLSGLTDADAALSGTAANPDLRAAATIRNGSLGGQRFDRLSLEVESAGNTVKMTKMELARDAGRVSGDGSYKRDSGALDVAIHGSEWRLDQVGAMLEKDWPVSGVANLDLRVKATVRPGQRPVEGLAADGSWSITSLTWAEHPFGDLGGSVTTDGDTVTLDWSGAPLGGAITGKAALRLDEDELTGASQFEGVDAAQVFRLAGASVERVSGELAGGFTFEGDPAKPSELAFEGSIEKAELTISELPGAGRGYALYNPFPMRWAIRNQTLELEHMRLQGQGTDFEMDGDIALAGDEKIAVAAEGMVNLAVLQSFRSDLQAEGSAVVNATAGGTLAEPRVDGRLHIANGSLRSSEFPNGLSALNGDITFAGRNVRVEELSALSGGGRVQLAGTASFAGEAPEYRFNVDMARVRLRYPANISSLIDGEIVLSGASNRGLLAGEVLVRRAATNTQISLGDLLAALRAPTQTPARAPWLDNVQLNLHVASGPDFELETALVRNIEADLDVRLVGTAISPSLLGRMNISQGQVSFNGTRYTINRGEVSFVNPFRLEPVLDFELETRIRGIDIGLILSGPARRLNMSYRSDPPLSISDLVNLVAVGRAPTLDPVQASQQRVQQQSLFQTGANNVFEHAIERPVSPGLQRFFGVSRLKVDPQAGGAEANPSARISTEQQITSEVTLIYTYDLSSAQQQTFRLEYAPDRRWTLVLTRDQNGLVGSDVLYKTRLP
jgi:translocation and assembly module TamB